MPAGFRLSDDCVWMGEKTTIGAVIKQHANKSYTPNRIGRAIAILGAQNLQDVDRAEGIFNARLTKALRKGAHHPNTQFIVSEKWHKKRGAEIQAGRIARYATVG